MARQRSAAAISIARPARAPPLFMRGRHRRACGSGTAAHGKRGRGRARGPGCTAERPAARRLWMEHGVCPSLRSAHGPSPPEGPPRRALAHIRSLQQREQKPGFFYLKKIITKSILFKNNQNAPIATPSPHWRDLALLLKNSGRFPFLQSRDAASPAQSSLSLGKDRLRASISTAEEEPQGGRAGYWGQPSPLPPRQPRHPVEGRTPSVGSLRSQHALIWLSPDKGLRGLI